MKRLPLSKRLRRKDLNEPFILTVNNKRKALVMPYSDYVKVRTLLAQAFTDSLEDKLAIQNSKTIQ